MPIKQIGITEEAYDALVEYKTKHAFMNKKSKYSFTDAILDLIKKTKSQDPVGKT